MKSLQTATVAVLFVIETGNAYVPGHWHHARALPARERRKRRRRLYASWEDLAADWTRRNSDQESSDGIPSTTYSQIPSYNDPNDRNLSPPDFHPSGYGDLTGSSLPIAQGSEDAAELWKLFDSELLEIQREALEALSGLEQIENDIDGLAASLKYKDESYAETLRDVENRGLQVEASLQGELSSLSRDFEAYRTNVESQQESILFEAEERQRELRSQIDGLNSKLQDETVQLEAEKLQSQELENQKLNLEQELQGIRTEASESLNEWKARLSAEAEARTRETEEFQARIQQIQDDASRRIELILQQAADEKQLADRDFSDRIQKVSEDLRLANSNLQQAHRVIEEKKSYIESLEPSVITLETWTQESWRQLTHLQDAVGLPVTPLENGSIPGIETIEAAVQELIEHLRSKERYFEDAVYDLHQEMQEKEVSLRSQQGELEREYDVYRREMSQKLEDSRDGAAAVEGELQGRIEALGADLEKQRSDLKKESRKAADFMRVRMGVETELAELKQEASYVIDGLEDQLEAEQNNRRNEAQRAKEVLQEFQERANQEKNKLISQGRERIRYMDKELGSRIAETEEDLRVSKRATTTFISVAATSIAAAVFVVQSMRTEVGSDYNGFVAASPSTVPLDQARKSKMSSEPAADDHDFIDWDALTIRWLKLIEEERMQSTGATPLVDQKDDTDPFDDPLLLQALVPPSLEDPFSEGSLPDAK